MMLVFFIAFSTVSLFPTPRMSSTYTGASTSISGDQGWGQVQLTKYSSTPSTPNIYQVQVLVKYSFFLKVLKYIKYFNIKYKYKYNSY